MASIERDVPWIDPPAWWEEGCIDGLTWPELLAREWQKAKTRPKTAAQQRVEEFMRRAGRALAEQQVRQAIEVLTGNGKGRH